MTLNPGDLLFVGWDADNDDISFITTMDISAGEVIYFTDDEWDGSAFFGSEQLMEWTVPAGGVTAGTVLTIDMERAPDRTATIDTGGSFEYIKGGYNITGANEMFWAFQGTRFGDEVTPTDFIAVIGNEADGNDKQTPNLTGTGLTTSNGAIIIDGDEDYMEWTGDSALPDPVDIQVLKDSILDTGNWTTADGGGNNNPNGTGFNVDAQTIFCFTSGTEIATAHHGNKPVHMLAVGDVILTIGGMSAIRWIGRRTVQRELLEKHANLYPVRIMASALGNNLPKRDLLVSRQHRMFVSSKIAERMFGSPEVLIPAIKLTKLPGIYVDENIQAVEYFHILFDQHEVIFAEGAPSESLYTGPEALKAVSPEARAEILEIFPELNDMDYAPMSAALIPNLKQQKALVARHLKNGKPLLSELVL